MRSRFGLAAKGLGGAIRSYRATLGIRRYQHDELVGDEVGTHFDNDTEEAELMLSHRPFGRLSGTVGGSFLNRAFNAVGEEALSPPIDQRGGALFLYEELTWPHVTLQFGGRVDRTTFQARQRPPAGSRLHGGVGIGRPPAASGRRERRSS